MITAYTRTDIYPNETARKSSKRNIFLTSVCLKKTLIINPNFFDFCIYYVNSIIPPVNAMFYSLFVFLSQVTFNILCLYAT